MHYDQKGFIPYMEEWFNDAKINKRSILCEQNKDKIHILLNSIDEKKHFQHSIILHDKNL
jgi:hypothetical protein